MVGLFAILAGALLTSQEPAFDIPNEESCKTLFAVESFTSDPTYLSPYQKCWVDRWRADDEHGVIGEIIWVRIEDQLFSLNRKALRTLREDQAKIVFEREIKRQYNEWKKDN